jgi:hypothetical protein
MGVAQLLTVVVFVAMWFPTVRQMLLSLGVFVIGAVILFGLVALGVLLISRAERKPPFFAPTYTTFDVATPPLLAPVRPSPRPNRGVRFLRRPII